jgi:hypothetical protein
MCSHVSSIFITGQSKALKPDYLKVSMTGYPITYAYQTPTEIFHPPRV